MIIIYLLINFYQIYFIKYNYQLIFLIFNIIEIIYIWLIYLYKN